MAVGDMRGGFGGRARWQGRCETPGNSKDRRSWWVGSMHGDHHRVHYLNAELSDELFMSVKSPILNTKLLLKIAPDLLPGDLTAISVATHSTQCNPSQL